MPYEHDAPVAYEEPVERTPTAVTRWWRDLPRTGLGFAFTVVLAAIAWFTGIARDGRGLFVAPLCVVLGVLLGEGTSWLIRRRRASLRRRA